MIDKRRVREAITFYINDLFVYKSDAKRFLLDGSKVERLSERTHSALCELEKVINERGHAFTIRDIDGFILNIVKSYARQQSETIQKRNDLPTI